MLATKRNVLRDGGDELLARGMSRSKGHTRRLTCEDAQKKTSGGVAPVHLRKYATARKPPNQS
jgi:hypothetical protein